MIDQLLTNRPFSRRLVRKIITIVIGVVTTLVIVVGGWTIYSKMLADAEKAEYETKKKMARNIAEQVQNNLEAIKHKLTLLAKNQQTISLFEEGDVAMLISAAKENQAQFEQALKLRYIKPGLYEVDSASVPPLSYASLDMLKKAETTSQINTEVHLFGTPNEHIVIIERVVNSASELVGFLHLSLDIRFFDSLTNKLTIDKGYAELIQRISDKTTLTLKKIGNAKLKRAEATTVNVNDTCWIIAYWSANESFLVSDNSSFGLPVIPIIILLLLVAAGIYFVIQKKRIFSNEADENLIVVEIDPVIFRAYDIRGVVEKSLTKAVVYSIAKAIGTMAREQDQQAMVIARDGRISSPMLSEALIKGLRSTGTDVIDIGMVPTPVLYFATYHFETGSGVMITGSHNAPEYNGLKIVLAGKTLSGDDIKEIQRRAIGAEHASGQGDLRYADISADYVRQISENIPAALDSSLKIVVDCANGAAGKLAPQLLKAIGQDVIEMHCDIDGTFPNHHPDPSQPENLQELIDKVKTEGADIGFAFDGDGDRLGVIDGEGNIIWPDRQMMLLAKDVLSRNHGANIIFDVKCSRYLKSIIKMNGGKPIMWKTGHSFIKNKMKEVDAPLAGEMSGHIFFKERWYGFDDALYTSTRFIEIFANAKTKPAELFAELPDGVSTPELRISLDEEQHDNFMEKLTEKMDVSNASIIDIDGLRIEYIDGWGLIRPSNTSPYIILRFEGENEAVLERIKSEFRAAIKLVIPDAKLPY